MLIAKQVDFCSVQFMELICSLSKRLFLRHGTNGYAICSSGSRLVMKPLPSLDGRRVREQSAIWVNGIPIQKIILILRVSIERNGSVYQRGVGTSVHYLQSSSDESRCTSSWCRVRAMAGHYFLWNSSQLTRSIRANELALCWSPALFEHIRNRVGGDGIPISEESFTLLVLRIQILRQEGKEIERVERRGFVVHSGLGELGHGYETATLE